MSERRIIRGAVVMALEGRRTLRKTDILIENGTIAATGGTDTEGALITDARGVVMPGLVQANLRLSDALLDGAFAPSVDPRHFYGAQQVSYRGAMDESAAMIAVRAGLARGLSSGVVGYADGSGFRPRVQASAAAFGARVVLLVEANSGRFLPDLQQALAAADDRITVGVGIEAADRTSGRKIARAAQAAFEHQLPIVACATRFGRCGAGVAALAKNGALGPQTSVSGLWGLDSRSARLLADARSTAVLHLAEDLVLGAPPPPFGTLNAAGVKVALCSGSNVSRLGFDLFAEARLAMRHLEGEVDAPASAALEMIAPNPASALGLNSGVIEAGKAADLLLVDVEAEPSEDHETVARRLLEKGEPEALRSVWIQGQVVASEGRPRLADPPDETEEEAIARALGARVLEEEERPGVRHALQFATRALWRARGWRL